MDIFADTIERARRLQAMSQQGLAEIAGFSRSTYLRLLAGRTEINLSQMRALAGALSVDMKDLTSLYELSRHREGRGFSDDPLEQAVDAQLQKLAHRIIRSAQVRFGQAIAAGAAEVDPEAGEPRMLLGEALEDIRALYSLSRQEFSRRLLLEEHRYREILSGDASDEEMQGIARAIGVAPILLVDASLFLSRKELQKSQLLDDALALHSKILEQARRARHEEEEGVSIDSEQSFFGPHMRSWVPLTLPQSARVWLQEFLLELAVAGASDQEIFSAREVLTSPATFSFYHGGAQGTPDEGRLLREMDAIASGIRRILKDRGRDLK
jgi:transcriptional regulator with XRE-family HTH domain